MWSSSKWTAQCWGKSMCKLKCLHWHHCWQCSWVHFMLDNGPFWETEKESLHHSEAVFSSTQSTVSHCRNEWQGRKSQLLGSIGSHAVMKYFPTRWARGNFYYLFCLGPDDWIKSSISRPCGCIESLKRGIEAMFDRRDDSTCRLQ